MKVYPSGTDSADGAKDLTFPPPNNRLPIAREDRPGTSPMAYSVHRPGYSNALALIKAGKTSEEPWSFDAADGDALLGPKGDDWETYGKFHLAVDPDVPADQKGHYHFAFGKAGRIYRRALGAIRQRASQFDHTEVFDAAGRLLDAWDKQRDDSGKAMAARTGLSAPLRPAGLRHKAIPFEVRAVDDQDSGTGWFEGIGGAFCNVDADGDILDPDALDPEGLKAFLADGFIGGIGHDWSAPIGHPAEATVTADGLYLKAVFDGSPDAQAVRAKMRKNPHTGRSTIRKLSIGYIPVEAERFPSAQAVAGYWEEKGYEPSAQDRARLDVLYAPRPGRDGKTFVPKVRLLKKIKLYEVSPVAVPANDRAQVAAAKGAILGDLDEAMAYAAADRLLSIFGGFLWQCLSRCAPDMAEDQATGVRPMASGGMPAMSLADCLDALKAGCDEFRDTLLNTLELLLSNPEPAAGESPAPTPRLAEPVLEAAGKRLRGRLDLPEDLPLPPRESTRSKAVAASAPNFADHSQQVVSAVQEFLARAAARADARLKEGRMLSQANMDEIMSVADLMESGCNRLRTLMSRAAGASPKSKAVTPGSAPDPDPAPPAAVAPPEAVPPAEVARLFRQYLTLEARVLGFN